MKSELVITLDYYIKNKKLLEDKAKNHKETKEAIESLKSYKLTWVRDMIRSKISLLNTLREEYNKPINREYKGLILITCVNLKKEIYRLRELQLKYPNLYAR